MKKLFLVLPIMALASMLLFVSCSDDKEEPTGDTINFNSYQVLIRFESESGSNLVDFLNLTNHEESFQTIASDDNDLVQVSCVRQTDGKQMELFRYGWFHPLDTGLEKEYLEAGTVLDIAWGEFYDDDLGKRPDYDEVYTVSVSSPKIFGSDEVHTIKWYSHIIGRRYDCYKCEVDGEDYAFTETRLYQSNYHPIKTPGYYTNDWKSVNDVIISIRKE